MTWVTHAGNEVEGQEEDTHSGSDADTDMPVPPRSRSSGSLSGFLRHLSVSGLPVNAASPTMTAVRVAGATGSPTLLQKQQQQPQQASGTFSAASKSADAAAPSPVRAFRSLSTGSYDSKPPTPGQQFVLGGVGGGGDSKPSSPALGSSPWLRRVGMDMEDRDLHPYAHAHPSPMVMLFLGVSALFVLLSLAGCLSVCGGAG